MRLSTWPGVRMYEHLLFIPGVFKRSEMRISTMNIVQGADHSMLVVQRFGLTRSRFLRLSAESLDSPKSVSLRRPSAEMSMLSGLMSLYTKRSTSQEHFILNELQEPVDDFELVEVVKCERDLHCVEYGHVFIEEATNCQQRLEITSDHVLHHLQPTEQGWQGCTTQTNDDISYEVHFVDSL